MIKLSGVSKIYQSGSTEIKALNNIYLDIKKGEFAVVLGPSGSGKSTLLNLIGGMDTPSAGTIEVGGENISIKSAAQMENYRRDMIGFVFQFISDPFPYGQRKRRYCHLPTKDHLDVDSIIDSVGLETENRYSLQFIRRRIATIIHSKSSCQETETFYAMSRRRFGYADRVKILRLLKDTAKENGITLIIVTHNSNLKDIADTVIQLKDGKIENIEKNADPIEIEQVKW